MCSICLEEIQEPYTLECSHLFHRTCIQHWFDTQLQTTGILSCPLCRHEHASVSQRQLRRLIGDGIVSLPRILMYFFPAVSWERLQRSIQWAGSDIDHFCRDPTYTWARLGVSIGVKLSISHLLDP